MKFGIFIFIVFILTVLNTYSAQEFKIPKASQQTDAQKIRDAYSKKTNPMRVYLNASSYSTDKIELSSQLTRTTAFTQTGPAIAAGLVLTPFSDSGFFSSLSPEFGLSFLSLERTGVLTYFSTERAFIQNAILVNALVALRLESPFLREKAISPFLTAGLLPGAILTSDSAVSDGTLNATLPFNVKAGVQIVPRGWTIGANLGAEVVTPSLFEKNTSGAGIFGGLQVLF